MIDVVISSFLFTQKLSRLLQYDEITCREKEIGKMDFNSLEKYSYDLFFLFKQTLTISAV